MRNNTKKGIIKRAKPKIIGCCVILCIIYSKILRNIAKYCEITSKNIKKRKKSKYCEIFRNIAKYCEILRNIAKYCEILLKKG